MLVDLDAPELEELVSTDKASLALSRRSAP
jgi:hypothetical protein